MTVAYRSPGSVLGNWHGSSLGGLPGSSLGGLL